MSNSDAFQGGNWPIVQLQWHPTAVLHCRFWTVCINCCCFMRFWGWQC